MGFEAEYLEEPLLKFDGGEAKDPRIGLLKYGPRTPSGKSDHVNIKTGIIGSSQSISGMESLFKEMRSRILPSDDVPRKWKPPFPGLGEGSPLNISINTQKRWRETFTEKEIEQITEIDEIGKRIEKALEMIRKKIEILYEKETPPDVVLISIPERIYQACTSGRKKKAKIQKEGSDFHNRIKLQGMRTKLPTQLIRPATLRGEGTQDKFNIAWNLAVGLLYKSQQGHPWKLAELEEGTCFAGISFYKERGGNSPETKAVMAQVFLETGESFILRADQVEECKGKGQNHLSEEDTKRITEKVLEQYRKNRNGANPGRLVLYKSSNFWDEERKGAMTGASKIQKVDLITIRENYPIRVFSSGDYPVLRGTLVLPPGGREYYLYTKGFIPTLGTHAGPRVPKPIIVRPDSEACNTPIQEICKEILSFTKLDWNTSHFCKKLPVTIEISRAVGGILAESKAKNIEIDPHYYFYM